tara:strand:- start:98 stop:226 length:129 start_codon:yes stop_codon:yes gene_type:complete
MCEKGLVKKEEPLRPFFLFDPVVVVVVVVVVNETFSPAQQQE